MGEHFYVNEIFVDITTKSISLNFNTFCSWYLCIFYDCLSALLIYTNVDVMKKEIVW